MRGVKGRNNRGRFGNKTKYMAGLNSFARKFTSFF
jgi:hypothetical protein